MKTAVLALLAFALGVQSDTETKPNATCPPYRFFNDSLFTTDYHDDEGLSIQYEAPNGCECVEGMDDMYCKMCTSDVGCQSENKNHVCKKSFWIGQNDTYKSYHCKLGSVLELLMPRGQLSVHMDIENKSAHMSLYNWDMDKPINGGHAIECDFWACDMVADEEDWGCDHSSCHCNPNQCNGFAVNIVYLMNGHKAFFNVTRNGTHTGEAHVALHMKGAPFDISADCNATACVEAPESNIVSLSNSTEPGK